MTSFRSRLILSVIGLVVLTALLLGAGSYLFVSRSLRGRFVDDAVAQAEFDIAELATTERLPVGAGLMDFEASGLAEAIRRRGGTELFVEFGDGEPAYASGFAVRATPGLIEPEVRDLVAEGFLAWQWMELDGSSYLVVGGRRPDIGPDFYIYFPAADVTTALRRLAQALLIGGAALASLAAVTARAIAGRVLRPVTETAAAASRIAAGDLSARLPVQADDEFGGLAEAFNHMAGSLERSIAELEQSRDREQQFVADVSHELRTPLTALLGEAALLAEYRETLPADAARLVELLGTDVVRLRELVEDLLEISRLEAGSDPSSVDRFDAARLVNALVDDRCPGAVIRAPPSLPVLGDRRRLERIVGNLLDNAVVHGGGKEVEVHLGREPGGIIVMVADRGPGVDSGDLEQIFHRFAKADSSRTSAGSGLGLAIARSHARALGGDLTARRREGGGLELEARLPVAESLPRGDAVATHGAHTHGDGSRSAPTG